MSSGIKSDVCLRNGRVIEYMYSMELFLRGIIA
jgi:hypothetical protein